MKAETSDEGSDGAPARRRRPLQPAAGTPPLDRPPSEQQQQQPPKRAAGLTATDLLAAVISYSGPPPTRTASISPSAARGHKLALRPILSAPRTMERSPPAPQPLQPSHPLGPSGGHADRGQSQQAATLPGAADPHAAVHTPPMVGQEERRRKMVPAPQLALRAVRQLHDSAQSSHTAGAGGAAWAEGSASLPLDLEEQLGLPRAVPGAAVPHGFVLQRGGGSREGAWWTPQLLGSHEPAGLGLAAPQHGPQQQQQQQSQWEPPRQLLEPGLIRSASAAGGPFGDMLGPAAGGGGERVGAPPAEVVPPVPIEVTVAVRVGAGGGRRQRGGANEVIRSGYMRGPVSGTFDVPRYLAGRDCIHNGNRWMSRSHFEKVGGSKMAKWYRSIRVLPDLEPLGDWLERHGMPVTKGPARRSSKRAADSGDEQGLGPGQEQEAADSPEPGTGIGERRGATITPPLASDAAAVQPRSPHELGETPELLADRMLLPGGANNADRVFLQRLMNTLPPSQQHILPQSDSPGGGVAPGNAYGSPARGAWGGAQAAPVSGDLDTPRWRSLLTDRAQVGRDVSLQLQPQPSPLTPPPQRSLQWVESRREPPPLSRHDSHRRPAPRQQGVGQGAGGAEDMDVDPGAPPDSNWATALSPPHAFSPRLRRFPQLGGEDSRTAAGRDEQQGPYDEAWESPAGPQRHERRQQHDMGLPPGLALHSLPAAARGSQRDAPIRLQPDLYAVHTRPGLQAYAADQRRPWPQTGVTEESAWREVLHLQQHPQHPQHLRQHQQRPQQYQQQALAPPPQQAQQLDAPQPADFEDFAVQQRAVHRRHQQQQRDASTKDDDAAAWDEPPS